MKTTTYSPELRNIILTMSTKLFQQGKKEQTLLNSDNTNSIMENITLALSNLELNVNKGNFYHYSFSQSSDKTCGDFNTSNIIMYNFL